MKRYRLRGWRAGLVVKRADYLPMWCVSKGVVKPLNWLDYSVDSKKGLVGEFNLPRPAQRPAKGRESLVSLKESMLWRGGGSP